MCTVWPSSRSLVARAMARDVFPELGNPLIIMNGMLRCWLWRLKCRLCEGCFCVWNARGRMTFSCKRGKRFESRIRWCNLLVRQISNTRIAALRQTNPVEEADGSLVAEEGGGIGGECAHKHGDEALVQCTHTLRLHQINKHTANAVLVLA